MVYDQIPAKIMAFPSSSAALCITCLQRTLKHAFYLVYNTSAPSCLLHKRIITHPLLFSAGVKLDPIKAWCPVVECQAVCSVQPSTEGQPSAVSCQTCHTIFCSGCRGPWQDGHTCPERQPMMSPSPSHESRSVSRSFGQPPAPCSHRV